MDQLSYQKVCQKLLSVLSSRTREIISSRFGLFGKNRETLEAIGKKQSITRERVRQIEKDGVLKLRPKLKEFPETIKLIVDELKLTGGLREERTLLGKLGKENCHNQASFILTLGEPFVYFNESNDCRSCWALRPESFYSAQKTIESIKAELKKKRTPLNFEQLRQIASSFNRETLSAYMDISKKIKKNSEGLFGLVDWPEISPKGVRDKAYLVLKKAKQPLHFLEVAKKIEGGALPQTVHNELIKDPKFVLVGRGLYGLKEWGYRPGVVKEIIAQVLKKANRPLGRKEVVSLVLKQRFVKENTIVFNLSDKSHFLKTADGRYLVQEI